MRNSPYLKEEDSYARREKVEQWNRGNLTKLPRIGSPGTEALGFDLRSYDVSGFSLKDKQKELNKVSFDSYTKWPSDMPDGFDPDVIMKTGMNPELGIRQLHGQGITGEGVRMVRITHLEPLWIP